MILVRKVSENEMSLYNIAFMGSKQAGCIGLLTLMALGHKVSAVVGYGEMFLSLACSLKLPLYDSIHQHSLQSILKGCDLLVSVHGREIVPKDVLALPRLGGINLHPCLYKYKGIRPIPRLLEDGETMASVGAHWMIDRVDKGEVILEEFVDVSGAKTPGEVYNTLYPYYITVLMKTLKKVQCNDMS